MNALLRPVKAHVCDGDKEWCSTCLAHCLDPQNQIPDLAPSFFVKLFLFTLFGGITLSTWALMPGCAVGPQRPTMVHEIHHEACMQQKVVDSGPTSYRDALLNAADDACTRQGE